jgi:hypothetical protein
MRRQVLTASLLLFWLMPLHASAQIQTAAVCRAPVTWNIELEVYLVPRNMDEACRVPPPLFDEISRILAANADAAPAGWEPYPELDGAYYIVPFEQVQEILTRAMGFMRPGPREGVVERVMLQRRSTCGTDPFADEFTACSRLDRAWSSNIESFRGDDGKATVRDNESVLVVVRFDGEDDLWQASFPVDEGFKPGDRVRVTANRSLERAAAGDEP